MHQALVLGEVEQLGALIDRLEGPQTLLAELHQRVAQFEHESILTWLEKMKV